MPYDGSSWNESEPTNSTLANEIDDVARDMKVAIRSRMAQEHVWTSSQTGTGEAGFHRIVSFQAQTAVPSMPVVASVTQAGMLFVSSGGLTFQNSAGTTTVIVNSAGQHSIIGARYSSTGTLGELVVGTSGGTLVVLAPGTSGQVLTATTGGAGVAWTSQASLGTFGARSFGTTYQETSDGFVVGYTASTSATHQFIAYHDSAATPTTTISRDIRVWAAGGPNISCPVFFPVKKTWYYSVNASGASGGTLQFIPIGT